MKWWLGAGLLLLAALILESGLLAYSMYVLLAVMLVSRLLARSWVAHVRAERSFIEPTAEVGDEVRVVVKIKNSGWLPVPWLLLEDLLPSPALTQRPPRIKVLGKRIQFKFLRPNAEVTLKYHIKCLMRGYHQIGPLLLESGDLFGLHRRYRIDAEPGYVLVYPQVVGLQGYDLASRRPIGDVQLVHRLFEDPTRNAGVRTYQPGDPLNRVHWGATARTGVLHSKIYEPSTLAGATLVLDFHRSSYPKRGEPHRSELAVTATVSLANAVFELGQQIGLVTNGRDAAERIRVEGWDKDYRTRTGARRRTEMLEESDRLAPPRVETRRGADQFHRIRETLARLELTRGLTLAQLVIETTSRLPRDATVVCITSEATEETAFALGDLRRSGYAVSVIFIWPEESTLESSYGRLVSEGVRDIRILKSEAELPDLCQQQVGRAAPYQLEIG